MRQTNPHNTTVVKTKELVHQTRRVEAAPAKAERSGGLDGLDDVARGPAGDAEADGRDPRGGRPRRVAVDGRVGARDEVREERRLQRLLVPCPPGPARAGPREVRA